MGIISLNEKRTSSYPTHTTGREKSFHATDRFEEVLGEPKLTGHYHYYKNAVTSGAFGVFWEDTSGNTSNLNFQSTQSPTFSANERVTQTHSSNSAAWSDFEIDFSGKPNGRPVFYVRAGTFRNDFALDDMLFTSGNESTFSFNPSVITTRTNGLWETSGLSTGVTSYAGAQSDYSSGVSLSAIPNNTSSPINQKYNYKTGGTVSSGTGPDNAANNSNYTIYLYFEATGSNNGNCTYLTWNAYRNVYTGQAL